MPRSKWNFRRRSADSAHLNSVPAAEIMSAPSTPTTTPSTRSRYEYRDTGFPEPFNGERNTTLPHPDADLSPNAILTSKDLCIEDAMRRRRSSLIIKHRRTMSSSSYGSSTFSDHQVSNTRNALFLITDPASSSGHGTPIGAPIPEHPLPDMADSTESSSSHDGIRDTIEMDDARRSSSSKLKRRSWFGRRFGRKK